MGSTPARGVDISPLKTDMEQRHVMSSSPPPMDDGRGGSPSKVARSLQQEQQQQQNGSTFLGNGRTAENVNANIKAENGLGANGNGNGKTHGISVLPTGPTGTKAEDSDDDGPSGFDLAKGFAPIGAPKPAPLSLGVQKD